MVLARLCIAAFAGLDNWAVEDVTWIITAHELRSWLALRDDAERERFIESFWLRRDPTPDTATNEFRDQHYWRLSKSHGRFQRGSGEERAFVTLGPPDHVEDDGHLRRKWRYGWIAGLGNGVEIQFVKSSGAFRLAHDADELAALFGPHKPVDSAVFLGLFLARRSEPRLLWDDRPGEPMKSLTVKRNR